MKRFSVGLFVLALLSAVVLTSCGGGAGTKATVEEANPPSATNMAPAPQKAFEPECYANLPKQDNDAIYGKGTATAARRQTAIDKADLIAAADLAANMERYVMERDFMREEDYDKWAASQTSQADLDRSEENYKNARKSVVSNVIRGSEEHCNEVYTQDGKYLVFRVLRLPVGKANKALRAGLEHNEVLWQMYKDSKALEELEADVRKFEEMKAGGR